MKHKTNYSVKEIADYLQIDVMTVHNEIKRKNLIAELVARTYIVSHEMFVKYLNRCRQKDRLEQK